MKYKNWVWDLDGTLMDTYPNMTQAFQKTLKHYGFDATYDDIHQWLKKSLSEAIAYYSELFPLPDTFIKQFRIYENEGTVTIYEGAKAFLEWVLKQGGRHFIWTHRDNVTHRYLKQWEIETLFEAVITSENGFKRKPEGEAMRHLIERYDLVENETIMIGDRALDILGANSAGVQGVLLTNYKDAVCKEAIKKCEDFNALQQFAL